MSIQIPLILQMIIYNQICCKIKTFPWPLEKLNLQLKKFLIDSHGKTFGTYFLILMDMAVFPELYMQGVRRRSVRNAVKAITFRYFVI